MQYIKGHCHLAERASCHTPPTTPTCLRNTHPLVKHVWDTVHAMSETYQRFPPRHVALASKAVAVDMPSTATPQRQQGTQKQKQPMDGCNLHSQPCSVGFVRLHPNAALRLHDLVDSACNTYQVAGAERRPSWCRHAYSARLTLLASSKHQGIF